MQKIITLVFLACTLAGCATSPTGRTQFMLVSPESAISESHKAYISTVHELNDNKQLITSKAWVDRMSVITGRLVTEAIKKYPQTAKWDWSVAIIDDPNTLNAWCMAGGKMAIYTGIVNQLKLSDDEIAQIMGHEIAHALANHSAERMSRALLMNAGLVAAAAVSENNETVLTSTAAAAKVALELPNSRTAESEADFIGIELAARAGYKPEAAVSLWEKMKVAGGKNPPTFLSTHPAPEQRAQALKDMGTLMNALNPDMVKAPIHPVKIITSPTQLKP